ncbi:hypothetical protein METUNv1_03964 [Methyloversatilis universalis FAM5]|uniref:Uncharacterized protein n=1 Tax=Methyloversatilis universalis (strain ATCC BAA-1314 / DSM 25237 / JCM 13912 / CCUG 52030 / FAM5) TaxID=1000565 RepID=F5RI14_METUF|nr:hypothetical protein METUNv1_03964 [Methyloversatilis universalis FAM5]
MGPSTGRDAAIADRERRPVQAVIAGTRAPAMPGSVDGASVLLMGAALAVPSPRQQIQGHTGPAGISCRRARRTARG